MYKDIRRGEGGEEARKNMKVLLPKNIPRTALHSTLEKELKTKIHYFVTALFSPRRQKATRRLPRKGPVIIV